MLHVCSKYRAPRCAAWLVAASALACLTPIADADTIEVKNKQLTGTVTLSDLIVYNAAGDRDIIKKAGDASDDEEIKPGESKRYSTGKEFEGPVTRYEISITTKKGEHEWKKRGREVTIIVPEEISYFDDAGGERPVHCAIDPGVPHPQLDPGAVFFVEGGLTPELPGLFFGLTYGVATGEILDPFTGEVQVREEELEVVIEPDAPCYADCDGSSELDIFDFLCFQNAFASGDAYADCDGSGGLDIFDFLCFQNEFAAGCQPAVDCYPDIRSTIDGAAGDPLEVQLRYDMINRSLHLYGALPLEATLKTPLNDLLPRVLDRLDTLETCTGLPTDVEAIELSFIDIWEIWGDLSVGDLLVLPRDENPDLAAAIDRLHDLGIEFPAMAASAEEAEKRSASLASVVEGAAGLVVADIFFKGHDEVSPTASRATQTGLLLGFWGWLWGDNDRCCRKGTGAPRVDACLARDAWTWCNRPPPSRTWCSIASDDCP